MPLQISNLRKIIFVITADTKGDDLEFLHFTAMTRRSFDDLLAVYYEFLEHTMIKPGVGRQLKARARRGKFRNRDINAIGLKFLLSNSELKNLHVQFGAAVSSFTELAWFAIDCFLVCVGRNKLGKVFWNRSEGNLRRCAERTKLFLDISGVVAISWVQSPHLIICYRTEITMVGRRM